MSMTKVLMSGACGLAMVLAGGLGAAQAGAQGLSDGMVKVGVLSDLSGPYQALGGPGTVLAAKMAIHDFGGAVLGHPIKLVKANHQNKPALASSIARNGLTTRAST